MQYLIKEVEIGTAFSSDHSPVKMSVLDPRSTKRGPGFWKFNKSVLDDPVFTENAKKIIQDLKQSQTRSPHKQANLEIMKYDVRKYSIKFSKAKAYDRRKTNLIWKLG